MIGTTGGRCSRIIFRSCKSEPDWHIDRNDIRIPVDPRKPRFLGMIQRLTVRFLAAIFFASGAVALAQSAAPPPIPVPARKVAPAPQMPPEMKSWCMLFQVMESLRTSVETRELAAIHNEDTLLHIAMTSLLRPSAAGRDEQRTAALLSFSRHVADLHAAADAFNQAESEKLWSSVRTDFDRVRSLYDHDMLRQAEANANRWTCPMHPDEVGARGAECPKCGMPLDQMIRPAAFDLGGTSPANTIVATITTDAPLGIGKAVRAVLQLRNLVGQPITPADLREVHTQKIHLLVVDSSLSDYHHEHPMPVPNRPGEYAFSFTPAKPGPYCVWADVRPILTGLQEYAVTDMNGEGQPEPIRGRATQLHAKADGLVYDLTLSPSELRVGQATRATLRIVDQNGKPFTQLEPVMAAFAHLVGFSEDRKTVLHSHPRGAGPRKPEERGGPELEFQLFPTAPGLMRLFVQVQIAGTLRYVPFTVTVLR